MGMINGAPILYSWRKLTITNVGNIFRGLKANYGNELSVIAVDVSSGYVKSGQSIIAKVPSVTPLFSNWATNGCKIETICNRDINPDSKQAINKKQEIHYRNHLQPVF